MKVNLEGQVAWVTGGAGDIGRAICESLAANGAAVAVLDMNEAGAKKAAEALVAKGYRARAWRADVTDKDNLNKVEEESRRELGVCTILINNAGINSSNERVPIHQYLESDWHKILAVDLTGIFLVSRAIIPGMLERKGGRIVNIASVAGMVPLAAAIGLCGRQGGRDQSQPESMACELGPQGILTNCVAPGSTLTEGTKSLFYGGKGPWSEKVARICWPAFRRAGREPARKWPPPSCFWSRPRPAILTGPCCR